MIYRSVRLFLLCSCVSSLGLAPSCLAAELPKIFNGKDLSGWKVPKESKCWQVKDGVLHVKNNADKQGETLWTDDEYENFVLELDFRFVSGTIDSGVFVRTEHEQIQIGISGSLKRDLTASPYIVGKGYPVEAKGVAELLKAAGWNTMTVVAKGPDYAVWLNNRLVMTYESETSVKRGPIGIQLHPDREMSIDFRNIRAAGLE
ncbi:hypothetical protein KOR34_25540 [Posidoniimonas corsicana]|uniref:3-keto-alpha-glucoside-1,2-lyase/3-keto-2-hydroxy-glucal hydratase domain-containing protein n=1 Tax=Posidoniimonas corsicana TaxID=1938618 RepID=A0A5C5VI63_9BACT|nr:DUF1080 domain-containing protein [Posidoniimonas corsicana]TWT37600.1 hypothetical protein KOR34_25540 [Posidoniimonas corsicana]